jgi:hypothetical protein
MSGIVRKILVGPNPMNSMCYTCGNTLKLKQEGKDCIFAIHEIIRDSNTGETKVYVRNSENEVYLWKSFSEEVPVSFEYNLDF